MTTMTINEIRELAQFAGLEVYDGGLDKDDMEAEITIMPCPETGVKDEEKGFQKYTGNVAYFSEMPEEGCHPLGELIDPLTQGGLDHER